MSTASVADELALLRQQADGDMRRLEESSTRLVSANAEIVRLNGCLNDAQRDLAELREANDSLRRIVFGYEIGEASLTKQLDEARRSLDEVHTRYRPQLQRADDTIKTLREDLAEANKRRPPRWPGLRASLLRRIGL
jgi:chromosome segregation ATPase